MSRQEYEGKISNAAQKAMEAKLATFTLLDAVANRLIRSATQEALAF